MFTDIEPGSDPRLAAVLSAARAPAELPLSGEAEALSAYRKPRGRSRMASRRAARPAQLVAAVLFGGLVVAGGVATAATGTVPIVGGQHMRGAPTVSFLPSHPDGRAATSAKENKATGETTASRTSDSGSTGRPAALGSVAKGVATCTKASQRRCQAGRHGKAAVAHDHHGTPSPAAAATEHRPEPGQFSAGSSSSHRKG